MNNKLTSGILAVLVLVFGYFAFSGGSFLGKASGPAHLQTESFLQGLTAGQRDQFDVSNVGDLTTSGEVTMSSILTLNKAAACVNFYATSTATRVNLKFVTTGATSTFNGTVYWSYGACT